MLVYHCPNILGQRRVYLHLYIAGANIFFLMLGQQLKCRCTLFQTFTLAKIGYSIQWKKFNLTKSF